uniref:Two pore domain potassium channel family protein n=1 Tax=Desulfacinum infernum TaxID=35837 RepID=A0A832EJ39_9BACT
MKAYQRLMPGSARFWSTDMGLSALLGSLTIYIFVVSPLSRHYHVGKVVHVFFALVLLSGLLGTSPGARFRPWMLMAAVSAVLFRWISQENAVRLWVGLGYGCSSLFFGLSVIQLLARVFQRGPKTAHRVRGAVAVYLMLGLLWVSFYQLVELLSPGAFRFPDNPDGTPLPDAAQQSALIYFSFVTLTTVGYGDVVAVEPFARSLAVMEALSGQLFPAVLLARIVALQVSEEQ